MTDAIPRSSQDLTAVESLGGEAMRRRINGRLFGESVEPIQLGHFIVVGTLGRGGMGVVYEARDDRLDRPVAIKVIRGGNRRHSEQLRLLAEARAQARLSHPNVVQIHEVRETGDDVFIVMELVRGVTLDHWLKERERSLPEVLAAFAAAGQGLAAAHAAGVVHRDVKPSNILVGDDTRVRIADFGLARGMHPEDSAAITRPSVLDPASPTSAPAIAPSTEAMAGTPAYMSPEHATGQPDARSDQFSFCVALYEAVQGRNPFAPDGLGALLGADALPLHFDNKRRKLPRWLRSLLTRGLARRPGDRFPSMSALLDELERAPRRRRRRWLAAAGIALFAVGALLFASLPSRGSNPDIGPVCSEDPGAFAGVWDIERRDALAQAFHATRAPRVDVAWMELERALDDYVRRWQTARRVVCEAQHAQPDPGVACLERQREVLGALIDVYSHPDPQRIAGVGEAIDTLPTPAACLDPTRLSLEVALAPELLAALERVEVLQRSGQGRAALPELATLVGAAQTTGNAAGEAEALLLRARIEAQDLAEFDRADATLLRAVELASTSGHDTIAWQIWNDRARLAAHERRDLEHAREWVGLARSDLERLPGSRPLDAASLLETESYVELLAERPDLALDLRRQSLQLREQLLPAGHPTLVRTRMLVANAIADAGDRPGALTRLRALLAEQTPRLGAEHPLTATIEYSAALIHFELEHHAEARRMLLHHREVFAALAGPHDPKVAESDLYLGFIAHAEENDGEAEARARAALEVFTARFPPTFPERVMALQLLLDIAFVADRYSELEARARELLALHELGARGLDEAGLLTTIGDSLCLQDRCGDALIPFTTLAGLVERDASLDPGTRAYPLQGLGRAHLARGDLVDAELVLERALELLQAHPDTSPELLSQTAGLLADTLQARHRDRARVRRLRALVKALEPRLRETDPIE